MLHKIISFFILLFYCFSIFFGFFINYTFGDEITSQTQNVISLPSTSSGNTDNSGIISTGTILEIPEFKVIFQQPSYILEKDLIKDNYNCDKTQTDCKANFKLTTLDDKDISTKFSCEIITSFSGTINNCNPNTLVLPIGENNIKFRIFEKGNESNFKEKNIIFYNLEYIKDNSGTISGTGIIFTGTTNSGTLTQTGILVNSGSIEILTGSISNSGNTDNSGIISTGTILEVPEFKITFQQPSYILEKDLMKDNYNCDKTQTDCKANFYLKTLDDKDISTKFSCEIITSFSGTISNCNPNTLVLPVGENNIKFRVFEKGNGDNFKEKIIIFYNLENTNSSLITYGSGDILTTNSGTLSQTGIIETLSGNTDDSGIISTGTILEIPEFKVNFQQPSYILEKDLMKDNYNCDKTQTDCKANFYLKTLDDKDISTKFICEIITSFSGTITDCNPNTLVLPIGENNIKFRIFEKGNLDNFKEKNIIFHNNLNFLSAGNIINLDVFQIFERNIVVQSGLQINNGNYFCNSEICKINLKFDNKTNETCEWDFGNSDFKDKYLMTCNPGTVYFKPGNYQINLKVRENGLLILEKNLYFENIYKKDLKENNNPVAKITLQTKLTKNRVLEGNKLFCINSKKCSVNFSGEESYDENKKTLKYYWDFGNGETGNISNPKSINYSTGSYNIKLKIENELGKTSEDIFLVEVGTEEEKLINEIDINVSKTLKIYRILGNPKGSDDFEWIELKNTGNKTINLKGLIIDDEIDKGSKAFEIDEDIYLKPGKIKRFYKYTTNLSLSNSSDEVNISYNSEIIDSFRWDFDLPAGYIIEKDKLTSNFREVFIEKVVDGDTILIKFIDGKISKLRLIGVDTPETKHPKKEIQAFGIEAYNFTKNNLEGKFVILEQDGENVIDKYGRLLGYIYLKSENSEDENIFFNKLLIQKGLARAYLYFPFKYSDEFKKSENIAKKDKIGLWGDKNVRKEFLEFEKEEEKYLKEKEKLEEKDLLEKIIENPFEENLNELTIFLNKFGKSFSLSSQKSFGSFLSWNFNKNSSSKKLVKITKKSKKLAKTKVKKIKFTQSISKQKKALKISGTTLPNLKIVIAFGSKNLELKSNNKGKYSIKIFKLESGNFEVKTKVYNKLGVLLLEKVKELSLTKEYVNSVRIANIKKIKKKKAKKVKKLKEKTIKLNILNNEKNVSINEGRTSIDFLSINLFIGFFSIILLFLIFKRLEYFGINKKFSIIQENYRNSVIGILGE